MDGFEKIWSPEVRRLLEEHTRKQDEAAPQPTYHSASAGIRLYEDDALRLLVMLKSSTFDLIFADPPYFLSSGGITCHAGKMVSVNKGEWDKTLTLEDMHNFNMNWLSECTRLLKPDGTIWVSGTMHNIHSVGYAMQQLGLRMLNEIAWYKINPPPNLSCRYFTHGTETILWAKKSKQARHTYNYELMKDENGGRQMQSLWNILPPRPHEKRHGKHPTQKPEALLERIIRAASNPGDLVLDPFSGSGTTGVVCAQQGRRFIGIEQQREYNEIAMKRLNDVCPAKPIE